MDDSAAIKRVGPWVWLFGLTVISAALFVSMKSVDWRVVWLEVRRARPEWLAAAVLFNFAILGFWAWQWLIFVPGRGKTSWNALLKINMMMATTMNTVPFMAGHALGVVLLGRQIGYAASLAVLALDQAAEGMAKASLLILVGLSAPIPDWLRQGIPWVVGGAAVLFTVLVCFSFRASVRSEKAGSGRGRIRAACSAFINQWARGLEAIRNPGQLFAGLMLGWVMKAAEAAAIWAVQMAFGLDLPWWSVFLILSALCLATMIPVSPGNLGMYEAAVFFVYRFLGLEPETALGLALCQHLCYLIALVAPGYLLMLRRGVPTDWFRPVGIKPAPTPADTLIYAGRRPPSN